MIRTARFNPNNTLTAWQMVSFSTKEIDPNKLIKLLKFNNDDYFQFIKNAEVKALDHACYNFVQEITKNLSGSRKGNTYKLKFKENKNYIYHVASAKDEYPAIMTGRLRASISYANSETKAVKAPNLAKSIITKSSGKAKLVDYKDVAGFYEIKDDVMPDDFVKPEAKHPDFVIFSVGTHVPYAVDLEFGLVRNPEETPHPRPFMRRTFQESFDKIYKDFVQKMREGLL